MTCIVAIEEKGNVYIGGDSAGVSGLSVQIRADEKVFENGCFIMGFTSSFRMGQLLRYKFDPPKQTVNQSDMKYMVSDFVDAVRACFEKNGFGKVSKGSDNEGGTFLVGYNGSLYCIEGDFQVAQLHNKYAAVGCGRDLALGSLYSTEGKAPEFRIKKALEAASAFSAGVAPPFVIVKQLKKKEKQKEIDTEEKE
jgi:ATP-dependent protease HslVU (ClpYQ) peptidase subunit